MVLNKVEHLPKKKKEFLSPSSNSMSKREQVHQTFRKNEVDYLDPLYRKKSNSMDQSKEHQELSPSNWYQ